MCSGSDDNARPSGSTRANVGEKSGHDAKTGKPVRGYPKSEGMNVPGQRSALRCKACTFRTEKGGRVLRGPPAYYDPMKGGDATAWCNIQGEICSLACFANLKKPEQDRLIDERNLRTGRSSNLSRPSTAHSARSRQPSPHGSTTSLLTSHSTRPVNRQAPGPGLIRPPTAMVRQHPGKDLPPYQLQRQSREGPVARYA